MMMMTRSICAARRFTLSADAHHMEHYVDALKRCMDRSAPLSVMPYHPPVAPPTSRTRAATAAAATAPPAPPADAAAAGSAGAAGGGAPGELV